MSDRLVLQFRALKRVPEPVETKNVWVAGLLTSALLLMSWGSLRSVVEPLGYWLLWLVWAAACATTCGRSLLKWRRENFPLATVASFFLLVAGMLLAAATDRDPVSAYQASKILVVACMFVLMRALAMRSSFEQLMRALYAVLALVFVNFAVCRLALPQPFPYITDSVPREGDWFAHFGVLWKVGALFLPLVLADAMIRPGRLMASACAIGACVFFVLVDGSRTGFLLMLCSFIAMAGGLWLCRGRRLLFRCAWLIPLAGAVLMMLLFANTAVNTWKQGSRKVSHHAAANAPEAGDIAMQALAPVANTRLGSGHPLRTRLWNHALSMLPGCFPLGCGFRSTDLVIGKRPPMPVHNGYLAALVDFGVLGMLGMFGFVVAALLPLRVVWNRRAPLDEIYFRAAAAGSALAYCAALMLNTFSSEMSEWGYLLIMLAFAHKPLAEA